jgi:hypothetical protein
MAIIKAATPSAIPIIEIADMNEINLSCFAGFLKINLFETKKGKDIKSCSF